MSKMINDFKNTWLKVIKTPGDFFLQMPAKGGYADPVRFAAICYLIAGISMSIITLVGGSTPGMVLSNIILLPVIGVVGIFIGGYIVHIFFKILGGKGTYEGTVRLLAYTSAIMVISWIPFLFILPDLYMIYMAVIGGTKIHKISTTRSVIAVLTPLIIVIVLIGAIVFVIFSIGGMSLDPSVMSKYNFNIEVSTDSKLENLIFYLPLPVFKDGSKLGDEAIIQNKGNPEGWDLSMIETEHGKMLMIIANEYIPEYRSLPVPIQPGEETGELPKQKISETFSQDTPVLQSKEITVMLRADHTVNTTNPENEPLLSPKYNLTLSSYDAPHPEGWTPPVVYKYESCIYADYEASPGANLSVHIILKGMNSWWVNGWSGNEYSDRIEAIITGEQHGWSNATGNLEYHHPK